MTKHTLEELGDFADSHTDGSLTIWRTGSSRRGRQCPEGKPWGARFGLESDKHYGSTPDEAIDAALNAREQNLNPDNQED